ncbi:hypothetical protein HK097_005513, partial [Rhizophlyctis rosea]
SGGMGSGDLSGGMAGTGGGGDGPLPRSTTADAPIPSEGFKAPTPVHRGVLRQGPGEEDMKRQIQRDINYIYSEVDRTTDFTLVCLSTIIVVLSFSQLLDRKETFTKYLQNAHELSMDFVSNTLKTVWDLLNRELPTTIELRDVRDPFRLRDRLADITRLRQYPSGRLPRLKSRKLYRKFALLHDLFTSVDVHLFPNFIAAHPSTPCKSLRFSAFDPAMWLSGGYDCVIRIHDIRPPTFASDGTKTNTGHTCLAQYVGHKSIVTSVHFTKDDRHILSSSFDRTLKIWNAQSASCERTLTGHTDSITSCDITPDSRHIASSSTDSTVRLWDFTTGECLTVIKKHVRWTKVVKFSTDGRYLLTAGLDKRVYIWDLKLLLNARHTPPTHTRLIESHTDYILDMATSRPSLLLTTSRDSSIRLFDYITGHELATIDLSPSWACTVAFSEDGQYFAAGTFDNNVGVWRTRDCVKVRGVRVLNLGIVCLRFWRDLSCLVVGTQEGFLQQIPL